MPPFKSILSFFLFLILSYTGNAQCHILIDSVPAVKCIAFCEGEELQFDLNAPGKDSAIEWKINSQTYTDSSFSSVLPPGFNSIYVTGSGPKGTCTQEFVLTIIEKPQINIIYLGEPVQCHYDQEIKFLNRSSHATGIESIIFQDNFGNRRDWFCQDFTDTLVWPSMLIGEYGDFDLRVTATNQYGCSAQKVYDAVTRIQPALIQASVKYNSNCRPDSNAVSINLRSYRGEVDSFEWDFGDGTVYSGSDSINTQYLPQDNNSKTYIHHYQNPGLYTLTLKCKSKLNGCEDVIQRTIPYGSNPVPKFTYSLDTLNCSTRVHLKNESTIDTVLGDSLAELYWTWGYPGERIYNEDSISINLKTNSYVRLIVTSKFGCSSVLSEQILASGALHRNSFELTNTFGLKNQGHAFVDSFVRIKNTSIGTENAFYIVDWGDNKFDTFYNSNTVYEHIYTEADYYFPSIIMVDSLTGSEGSCRDTFPDRIDCNFFLFFCIDTNYIENKSSIEMLSAQISIYPNPTHGQVHFESPVFIVGREVEVYNYLGNIQLKGEIDSNGNINIESLAPGYYIIKLQVEDQVIFKTLIKS